MCSGFVRDLVRTRVIFVKDGNLTLAVTLPDGEFADYGLCGKT